MVIKLINFHGVMNNKDHHALDVFTHEERIKYFNIVKQLNCDTIIEVFNKTDLKKKTKIIYKYFH